MSAIIVDSPENREAFAAADEALVHRIKQQLSKLSLSTRDDKSKGSKEQATSDK